MDWGIDFKFLLMNPSLLFALLTILLMCGFQERLFDMSMPRCVVTGIALSVSSYIVYGLSIGATYIIAQSFFKQMVALLYINYNYLCIAFRSVSLLSFSAHFLVHGQTEVVM